MKINKISDHNYKVVDKFMITNNFTYKYENPYNVQFLETQFLTNGTVTLKWGAIKIRNTVRRIEPHTSDAKVEDITTENMYDNIKK